MKITKATLIISSLVIAACSTTKKSTTNTTASTTPVLAAPTTPSNSILFVKPVAKNYVPGNEELVAIQMQYKDVTMEKLKQGYAIYTEGECIKCHGANNIYEIRLSDWKGILDNMAQKAYLSDTQKDAVNKYVLSIKATQK